MEQRKVTRYLLLHASLMYFFTVLNGFFIWSLQKDRKNTETAQSAHVSSLLSSILVATVVNRWFNVRLLVWNLFNFLML